MTGAGALDAAHLAAAIQAGLSGAGIPSLTAGVQRLMAAYRSGEVPDAPGDGVEGRCRRVRGLPDARHRSGDRPRAAADAPVPAGLGAGDTAGLRGGNGRRRVGSRQHRCRASGR